MPYIHQLHDWPRWRVTSSSVTPPLIAVVRQQAFLQGRLKEVGFSAATDLAIVDVTTEDAVQTSAIEGETLAFNSVKSSVGRRLGVETGLTLPEDKNVAGLVDMLIDATQNCDAPLTARRLWHWHSGLFPDGKSGGEPIVTGAWRIGPMYVMSGAIGREKIEYEAPAADGAETEMSAFFEWFNLTDSDSFETSDLLIKAAVAHLYFVTIHPFDDGNGRIGRAIADILIARSDNLPGRFYSLSSQIAKERRDYYAALKAAQSGSMDVTPWVTWFLGCLGRAVETSNVTIDRIMLKTRLWRRLEGYAVNERQRKMIDTLCSEFEGKLTSDKWAQMTKTTKITAIRDIELLVSHGVLRRVDAGRNTSYEVVG